ncbi:MAG: hypothetical protein LBU82_02920 [Treponema sp.]|nr:hypothetical protein [Treponema sp.]
MKLIIKERCLGFSFLFTLTLVLLSLFQAEPIHAEEPFLVEEPLFAGETLPTGETPLFEGIVLPEDPFPTGEKPYGEAALINEESEIFEAPPLVIEASGVYESRYFDDVFPGLTEDYKAAVFSRAGLKHSFVKDEPPALVPAPNSGINILSGVMEKNPSHIVEALVVVPYAERELSMLDVYNSLRRIENLKDQTLLINGKDYSVFLETTRLESVKSRKPVSDPPPAIALPYKETMYLRFKEVFLGNIYLRGELSVSLYGITYSMTNFTDVRYLIFPIMKAEKFSTVIYLEPVKEGVLIYSISGLYIPGFIADRVNLTPSVNNRITVLLKWITAGLRMQENES